MTLTPYSFCHRCGTPYSTLDWPRICLSEQCRLMLWRPINPVAVLLQPVRAADGRVGVIVGKRGIMPHRGVYALPGGFVEWTELSRHAAAREIFEEMMITAGALTFSHEYADDEGHYLLFWIGEIMDEAVVRAAFRPTTECTDMRIAFAPEELAFKSHTAALAQMLNEVAVRFG